jgi:hypothetical protein
MIGRGPDGLAHACRRLAGWPRSAPASGAAAQAFPHRLEPAAARLRATILRAGLAVFLGQLPLVDQGLADDFLEVSAGVILV